MLRHFFLIAFCCLLVSLVRADFSESKAVLLSQKLNEFVAPFGSKVGVCFIDLKTSQQVEINGHRRFLAASVAKLPVMAAAYHLAESGKLNLEKKIPLRKEDKLGGSGVLQYLRPKRQYTLRNLTRLMIVLSDNTATRLLVRELSLPAINNYCQTIGLTSTEVVDETMLNEPPAAKLNYTTPYDMALFCAKLKAGQLANKKSTSEMLDYMKNQKYRWGIWKGVPRGVKVADKTGNIEGVLNDVGIVYSPAGNYVLAVFTQGFAKKREARKVINKISQLVYCSYLAAER